MKWIVNGWVSEERREGWISGWVENGGGEFTGGRADGGCMGKRVEDGWVSGQPRDGYRASLWNRGWPLIAGVPVCTDLGWTDRSGIEVQICSSHAEDLG